MHILQCRMTESAKQSMLCLKRPAHRHVYAPVSEDRALIVLHIRPLLS